MQAASDGALVFVVFAAGLRADRAGRAGDGHVRGTRPPTEGMLARLPEEPSSTPRSLSRPEAIRGPANGPFSTEKRWNTHLQGCVPESPAPETSRQAVFPCKSEKADARGHFLAGNRTVSRLRSGGACPRVPALTYPFCTRVHLAPARSSPTRRCDGLAASPMLEVGRMGGPSNDSRRSSL